MSEIEGESTGPETPLREPAFNAPAVSLAFVALLLIAYAVQVFLLSPDDVMALALSSPALAQGRWWTLISLTEPGAVSSIPLPRRPVPPVTRMVWFGTLQDSVQRTGT